LRHFFGVINRCFKLRKRPVVINSYDQSIIRTNGRGRVYRRVLGSDAALRPSPSLFLGLRGLWFSFAVTLRPGVGRVLLAIGRRQAAPTQTNQDSNFQK